jgi:hypothetical protein
MEEQYQSLLSDLRNTLQSTGKKRIGADDSALNNATISQVVDQDNAEYNKRNRLYTQLLETYIDYYRKKEKHKGIYKCIFFIVTIFLFVVITVGSITSMVLLSIYGDGSLANVGIAIANIVTIISTIIVLPKIIAEHLFPTNEAENMLEMVKNMQYNDSNIRNILYKDNVDQVDGEPPAS